MVYIFIFLGEFGYELLNWQGVVRGFTHKKNNHDKVICCSRKGLNLLYENCDLFIDVSELKMFKNSVANGYRGVNPQINDVIKNELVLDHRAKSELHSLKNYIYKIKIHNEIKKYVINVLSETEYIKCRHKFIFSDEFHILCGYKFGRAFGKSGDIYAGLNISNNEYTKIACAEEAMDLVRQKLKFDISDPYILVQKGHRKIVQRSKSLINEDKILRDLSEKMKVVVLNFKTGRNLDSESNFSVLFNNIYEYNCDNFLEQSELIANALNCVFFTDGDFRSHNYIPPFMGKDVFAIASETVFSLPTAPIDFWNKNIFKFGGAIVPIIAERLISDKEYYYKFIESATNHRR